MAVMELYFVGGEHMIELVDDHCGAVKIVYAGRFVVKLRIERGSLQKGVHHSSTEGRVFPPSLFQQVDNRGDIVESRAKSPQLTEGGGSQKVRLHQLTGSLLAIHRAEKSQGPACDFELLVRILAGQLSRAEQRYGKRAGEMRLTVGFDQSR